MSDRLRDEIARTIECAWELGHAQPRPLVDLRDLAVDAILREFDVRDHPAPQPPRVKFTAMSDDAMLVLHKVRIEGPFEIAGERFAEGSGITECYFDRDANPLPGVPFIAVSVDGEPLDAGGVYDHPQPAEEPQR